MINLYAFRRSISSFGLTVLLLTLSEGAAADTSPVSDLYAAKVELADNSSDTQRDAFKQALGKVLIKLSGTREILDAPETESIMNRSSRFVQSYNKEKMAANISGQQDSGVAQQMGLHVEFDGQALERALITAGLPVWSGARPVTLVWLAVEDGRQRYVLAEGSKSVVLSQIQQAAAERGLPIVIPLMDQTDQRQVEFIDVRGGFTERLKQAAERYNPAMLLVGSLQSGGQAGWLVKWTVMGENTSSSWIESDLPLQQALQSGIDGLTDIMASRYAFISTPGGQLSEYLLSVDKVSTLEHYASILSILEDLVFVKSVTPIRIKDSHVQFRLRMSGSARELERALVLSKQLQVLDAVPKQEATGIIDQLAVDTPSQEPIELHFTWNP